MRVVMRNKPQKYSEFRALRTSLIRLLSALPFLASQTPSTFGRHTQREVGARRRQVSAYYYHGAKTAYLPSLVKRFGAKNAYLPSLVTRFGAKNAYLPSSLLVKRFGAKNACLCLPSLVKRFRAHAITSVGDGLSFFPDRWWQRTFFRASVIDRWSSFFSTKRLMLWYRATTHTQKSNRFSLMMM